MTDYVIDGSRESAKNKALLDHFKAMKINQLKQFYLPNHDVGSVRCCESLIAFTAADTNEVILFDLVEEEKVQTLSFNGKVLDVVFPNQTELTALTVDSNHLSFERLKTQTVTHSHLQLTIGEKQSDISQLFWVHGYNFIASGPAAKASLFLKESDHQVIDSTLPNSIEYVGAIDTVLFGVVTDVYGTGGVACFYNVQSTGVLQHVLEMSLRDIVCFSASKDVLSLISVDNDDLYCTRLNLGDLSLVADEKIEGQFGSDIIDEFWWEGPAERLFVFADKKTNTLFFLDLITGKLAMSLKFQNQINHFVVWGFKNSENILVVENDGQCTHLAVDGSMNMAGLDTSVGRSWQNGSEPNELDLSRSVITLTPEEEQEKKRRLKALGLE